MGSKIAGDEVRRFLGQEDEAVDVVQHLNRNFLQPMAADQDDDRHVQSSPADEGDQLRGPALQTLLAPIDQHTADRGIGTHHKLGIVVPARPHNGITQPFDLADDLEQALPLKIRLIECRCADQKFEAAFIFHCVTSASKMCRCSGCRFRVEALPFGDKRVSNT